MKFNNIIGNPPYQELKPGNKKSQAIWMNFVDKGLDACEEEGYFSMVHPPGWRNLKGNYKNIQKKMMARQFLYLAMHDVKEGIRTFGATTPYDYYVIRNADAWQD